MGRRGPSSIPEGGDSCPELPLCIHGDLGLGDEWREGDAGEVGGRKSWEPRGASGGESQGFIPGHRDQGALFSGRCLARVITCTRTCFQELSFNHRFSYSFSQIFDLLCGDEGVLVCLLSSQRMSQSFQLRGQNLGVAKKRGFSLLSFKVSESPSAALLLHGSPCFSTCSKSSSALMGYFQKLCFFLTKFGHLGGSLENS